jgi:hypothetical protein
MKLPLLVNVSFCTSPGVSNLFCVLIKAMLFTRVRGNQFLSFKLSSIFGIRFLFIIFHPVSVVFSMPSREIFIGVASLVFWRSLNRGVGLPDWYTLKNPLTTVIE